MEEEWRTIEGICFGKYEVSSFGRIRNKATKNIIKQEYHQRYYRVKLGLSGTHIQTHRAVAMAFVPNPHNLDYVDHIDRNTQNNSSSNLRWVSAKENSSNLSYRNVKKFSTPVTISMDFVSMKDCADFLGVRTSRISEVLSGQTKTLHGYRIERNNSIEPILIRRKTK